MLKFFKDSHGKVVIAQRPNAPLIVWFVSFLLTKLSLPAIYVEFFGLISFGAIFTWAWMEIFDGVNVFRRLLGLIVIAYAIFSRLY